MTSPAQGSWPPPGHDPRIPEGEARFFVAERLSGRFPVTLPQLPKEIYDVFSVLSATRGAEGAKAAFVLGIHAEAIIATVHEAKDAVSRGRVVERRAAQLLRLYLGRLLVPRILDLPKWACSAADAEAARQMWTWLQDSSHTTTQYIDACDRWLLHGDTAYARQVSSPLAQALPKFRGTCSPQAPGARAAALWDAFAALSATIPLGFQVEILLQWCDARIESPYQGVGAENNPGSEETS
jgi:hypothetical protein